MRAFNKGPLEAGNLQMIRMKSSYGGSSIVEIGLPFVRGPLCHVGLWFVGRGIIVVWRKGEIHSVLRVYCNSTENCLLYFRSRHRDQKVQSLGQDDLGFQIQWDLCSPPFIWDLVSSVSRAKRLCVLLRTVAMLGWGHYGVKNFFKGKASTKIVWFPALK